MRGLLPVAALSVVIVVWPTTVYGQEPVQSLEQARTLLAPGADLTVLDASGTVTRGKLSAIVPGELSLDVGGSVRRWTEADVRQIRHRVNDSVLNGVIIGAAIGAGLPALMYFDNECRGDPACAAAVARGAAIGALAGGIVDALIRPNRLIYQHPSIAGGRHVHLIVPALPWRAGAQLCVDF